MHKTLLVASSSASRRVLLQTMRINFAIIKQDADEHACDWSLPLETLVAVIAVHKMAHAQLPSNAQEGDVIFVLTADTLTQDMTDVVHGKATTIQEAVAQIKAQRAGSKVSTAFCLDKKIFTDGIWITQQQIVQAVTATCIFDVPEAFLEKYLDYFSNLHSAGSIAVEEFGMQFLKDIQGSYSGLLGLPLFELRQALETLGFYL